MGRSWRAQPDGAFGRVARDATAFAYRSSEMFVMAASFLAPGAGPGSAEGFDTAWAGFAPHAEGIYGNFSPATSDEITAAMYPPDTLSASARRSASGIRRTCFAHNHNIAP